MPPTVAFSNGSNDVHITMNANVYHIVVIWQNVVISDITGTTSYDETLNLVDGAGTLELQITETSIPNLTQYDYITTMPYEDLVIIRNIKTDESLCGPGSVQVGFRGGVGPWVFNWEKNGSSQPPLATFTEVGSAVLTGLVSPDAVYANVVPSSLVTQSTVASGTQTIGYNGSNLPISATGIFIPACENASNGGLKIGYITGGAGYPYTVTAKNNATNIVVATYTNVPATSSFLGGLPPAVYTFTISDASSCGNPVVYSVVTVNELNINVTESSKTDVVCNGLSTGAYTANVVLTNEPTGTSGTPSYRFGTGSTIGSGTAISTGSKTISGLAAGTYNFQVLMSNMPNQCSDGISFTISQPVALTATATATNILCSGGSNGTATASASGGTPGYTYLWSNGATTQTATGLVAGSYSCTVKDSNLCTTATNTVQVTSPSALVASATVSSNNVCSNGTNGVATASASGGTPAYSYLWSNNATTQTITGLANGSYTCTVTDNNSCTTVTNQVQVTSPPALVATATSTNILCSDASNGTATASASGGTPGPGYTYLWSNGATTQTATGLVAGSYSCTVKDSNLCTTATNTVQVTSPSALVVSAAVSSNNVCFNGTSGVVTASASGGTPGYTFLWSNGATTQTITGLANGSYSCTVTDSNSCMATTNTVEVTSPTALVVSATVSNNNVCSDGTNGVATASASGGTPGYTYLWSNGATTQTATGLANGSYTCTVTDSNSCTATTNTVEVTSPPALVVSATATSTTCANIDNGTATASASGGTPAYSYLWSNGATTQTITGLAAGPYTCTVTDANGCAATTDQVQVTSPPALVATATATAACFNTSNGTATASASGGTPGYTYLWSNGNTNQMATNLAAGSYSCTVTDSNLCTTLTNTVEVTSSSQVVVSLIVANNYCSSSPNEGQIQAVVVGGTPPYTYQWNTGQQTSLISNLANGGYLCNVTDANGCTGQWVASVSTVSSESFSEVTSFNVFNICTSPAVTTIVPIGTAGTTALPPGTWDLEVLDQASFQNSFLAPAGVASAFSFTPSSLSFSLANSLRFFLQSPSSSLTNVPPVLSVISTTDVVYTGTMSLLGNSGSKYFTIPFSDTLDISSNPLTSGISVKKISVSFPASTGGGHFLALSGGDPHFLCLDGTRLDIYEPGSYRLFDNGVRDDVTKRVIVNATIETNSGGSDYFTDLWIAVGTDEPICKHFEGNIFAGLIDSNDTYVYDTTDPSTGTALAFIMEGKYNTIGMTTDTNSSITLAGGAFAGAVHLLDSLDDRKYIDTVPIVPGAFKSHSLVCGSSDPHIVTLGGFRKSLPSNDIIKLFSLNDVVVSGTFRNGRIENMVVTSKDIRVEIEWCETTFHAESRRLSHGLIRTFSRTSEPARHGCNQAETTLPLEGGAGMLFIRAWKGGGVSLCFTMTTEELLAAGAVGALACGGIIEGKESMGLYAKHVEKHLC